MGRGKKKTLREAGQEEPDAPSAPSEEAQEAVVPQTAAAEPSEVTPAAQATSSPLKVPEKTFFRRILPDLLKVAVALAVILFGSVIWYQPPLTRDSFPYVSYTYEGKTATDAKLYRPLAMPTRFYIELPKKLHDRYLWFSVDRRREVVALTEAPQHRFLGWPAIKRSDPLGLDLEFRKLDHSEWQVHFLKDAIVFSNAVLTVRMDTKTSNQNASN